MGTMNVPGHGFGHSVLYCVYFICSIYRTWYVQQDLLT